MSLECMYNTLLISCIFFPNIQVIRVMGEENVNIKDAKVEEIIKLLRKELFIDKEKEKEKLEHEKEKLEEEEIIVTTEIEEGKKEDVEVKVKVKNQDS